MGRVIFGKWKLQQNKIHEFIHGDKEQLQIYIVMLSDSVNRVLIFTWILLLVIPFILFGLATILRMPITFYLSQISWFLFLLNEILAGVGFIFSIYFATQKQSFVYTLLISFGISIFPFLLSFYISSLS